MGKVINSFLFFIDFILSFFDPIIEYIYNKFRENDYTGEEVDYIFLITYGYRIYTPSRLSTIVSLIFTRKMEVNQKAQGIISLFRLGNMRDELNCKINQFREFIDRLLYLENGATSTTDECLEALKIIEGGKKVLVVSEGAHSIRAKIVWQELCKDKGIKVYFTSNEYPIVESETENIKKELLEFDKGNPMWMQRSIRIWTLVNIALYPFYRFFPGVKFFAEINFHQPV